MHTLRLDKAHVILGDICNGKEWWDKTALGIWLYTAEGAAQ